MTPALEEFINQTPHLQELFSVVTQAVSLKAVILACLKLGLAIAVRVASDILTQRGQASGERPSCPKCGNPLESKGFLPRSIQSLLGKVSWKRRVWRCPQGCKIGQVAPFDGELGLHPNQRVSDDLPQVACALAVFLPFGISSALLHMLTGVEVSPAAIWSWVQGAGKEAMSRLEKELNALEGKLPDANEIASKLAALPLLLGGDGVMVPFRPKEGSPQGKTVWREVKVGIFARLGQHVTQAGKPVSVLVHRRLVAVLGSIEDFKSRMRLVAGKEGVLNAPMVVWVSDGGRGFWRLFQEVFSDRAQGILDFYHAAQNLWKGAKGWLDGRTKKAHQWFDEARHHLRSGEVGKVISDFKKGLAQEHLPDSVRKTLENVIAYLEGHKDHLNYKRYKELGLPIGSGMVESACKWLIQQRFKGVGMRWSEDGFNHLLHLRLAWVNETFDDLFGSTSSPN